MNAHNEPRRSFVKKTLATSVSISFAGLIRAHGEGTTETTIGGETTVNPWETLVTTCEEPQTTCVTTYDPWETLVTTYEVTTTYNPDESTIVTTCEDTTTWNPEETTWATTEAQTTTFNPDETTVVVTTEELTTTQPKFLVWGSPEGENGSSDGYSQIVKQFANSGYFLKLKMWCSPDYKNPTKISLTSTGEFYGNQKLYTIPEILAFSGDKVTPEASEFPDGQPSLENPENYFAISWLTGSVDQGDLRKHEVILIIIGTRSDPLPQPFNPIFVVKVALKGTIKHYEPGDDTWSLIASSSEDIAHDLNLTIQPEIA